MGRHLFRRTPLRPLLLSGLMLAVSSLLHALNGPLPPLNDRELRPVLPNQSAASPYLPPLQGHAASKSWSIGVEEEIGDRAEVARWIERWSSANGLAILRISAERAFEYRAEVDRIIRESGIPWEVTAIPVVESSWKIDAVSSSRAVGPWQFLEASARGRRLVIDAWRDDRRDVWRATEAAMSELAFYDRLFSDWLMAVAAYNAGPTRIRKLKLEGGFDNFWEMLDAGIIPPETRDYVPKVIAVAWVSSHAGRLGMPITWENPMEWERIPSTRSVHLDDLSRESGMSRALTYTAHRELNHPITPPPTFPYLLKVPKDRADIVRAWLEGLEEDGAPERFWRYTVRSGDTLSELAERYGISLSVLLSYNGHVRSGVLRIGERLYLPGSGEEPPGVEPDNLPEWKGTKTVGTGDTLWSISIEYGISPELLAEVNNRSMNGILPAGSVLKVPSTKRGEM